MIVVLGIVSWTLLVSLVVSVCAAARAGDAPPLRASSPSAPRMDDAPAWEPVERPRLAA
jgi:hypothetical protein